MLELPGARGSDGDTPRRSGGSRVWLGEPPPGAAGVLSGVAWTISGRCDCLAFISSAKKKGDGGSSLKIKVFDQASDGEVERVSPEIFRKLRARFRAIEGEDPMKTEEVTGPLIDSRCHFGSSHLLLEAATASAWTVSVCSFFLLHPPQDVAVMPRRGWSTADVPAGWIQIVRGPRPRSEQWPRASATRSAVPRVPSSVQAQPLKPILTSAKEPRHSPGCSTEQVGEGFGSVGRFHRTSGRRSKVGVGEGEAGSRKCPL